MRRKFGQTICDLAKKDKNIVLLVGDIGYGIFDKFREEYPKRFFNLGICEQSLISAASGMALEGLKPWVYTITPFLIERSSEQIKIEDLDLDKQLFEKINKFAPIKYILEQKLNNDHQVIELLEDILRDLVSYDLEFRIQELESKFSKDMSEATFNELKELKKEKNIN